MAYSDEDSVPVREKRLYPQLGRKKSEEDAVQANWASRPIVISLDHAEAVWQSPLAPAMRESYPSMKHTRPFCNLERFPERHNPVKWLIVETAKCDRFLTPA